MAALLTNSQQLIEAYSHASPEVLGEPHPAPRFREELPTKGDLIGFVMTSHFTLHLGQLSMWRRLVGFAPLF